MNELLLLREQHGSVFVFTFPDGQKIPWKTLSVGEFLEYEHLFKTRQHPVAYLENEIFKKCVLDEVLVDSIDILKAGIVSVIATVVLNFSGPKDVNHMNLALNRNREIAGFALHDMITVVCQAFPAYKPEELYNMSYDIFMLRLAQAERKLLKSGILDKPISFETPETMGEEEEAPERPSAEALFEIWESQQRETGGYVPKPTNPKKKKQTVITSTDTHEQSQVYTGHELSDKLNLETDMISETKGIYEEYVEEMKAGNKVKIKSTEDRKIAALARAKVSEEEFKKAIAKQRAHDKAEMTKALEERRKSRTRRPKKKR